MPSGRQFPSLRGFSPEALTLFNAITAKPMFARAGIIDDCITALIRAGVWAKLDCLYLFAAEDSQAALLNWKNPGTFDASVVSAPTFTANSGYLGNGSSSYVTSNFNASTAGGQYAQDAATMFAHNGLVAILDAGIMGYVTSANCAIFPRETGNTASLEINGDAVTLIPASTDGSGLWSATRRSSTEVEGYRNGVSLGSVSCTSEALVNEAHVFLRRAADFYTGPVRAGGFGGALSDDENYNLFLAISTYLKQVRAI